MSSGLPFPEVPSPWNTLIMPVPADVRSATRTIDPPASPGAPAKEHYNPASYVEGAAGSLEQLELAAQMPRPEGSTSLSVGEDVNIITGEFGVTLRRALQGGQLSCALAEIVCDSGRFDTAVHRFCDDVTWAAANRCLEILIHVESREKDARRVAFAITRKSGKPDSFIYLARLLLTSFDVAQWTDAELESGAESVN